MLKRLSVFLLVGLAVFVVAGAESALAYTYGVHDCLLVVKNKNKVYVQRPQISVAVTIDEVRNLYQKHEYFVNGRFKYNCVRCHDAKEITRMKIPAWVWYINKKPILFRTLKELDIRSVEFGISPTMVHTNKKTGYAIRFMDEYELFGRYGVVPLIPFAMLLSNSMPKEENGVVHVDFVIKDDKGNKLAKAPDQFILMGNSAMVMIYAAKMAEFLKAHIKELMPAQKQDVLELVKNFDPNFYPYFEDKLNSKHPNYQKLLFVVCPSNQKEAE